MTDVFHINSYFVTNKVHCELVSKLDMVGLSQVIYIPVKNNSDISKNRPDDLTRGHVIYSHCFGPFARRLWPIKMVKIWLDFKKHFKVNPGKVIHAHSLIVNGFIACLAKSKWGTPYIVTVRNTDINLFLKRYSFFRRLAHMILNQADKVITLSPAYGNIQLKRFFSEKDFSFFQKKLEVIPNGINDFWIENKTAKEKRCSMPTVIFIGRIDRNKNLETLIKACDVLNNNELRIKLIVIGDGPLMTSIKAKTFITEIEYKGYMIDKNLLKETIRNSDILAVTSYTESFGLVYPEAMSQGLPVIYTRGQGFDGFFHDGEVGFSVDPFNPVEIADKIKSILSDYSRISKNAYDRASNFSWSQTINKYRRLYLSNNNAE